MKKFFLLLFSLAIVLTACSSPAATVSAAPSPAPAPTAESPPPATAPAVYRNPLTGLQVEKDLSGNRPYAVMLNNIMEAQPQCGIGSADIIYEVLAEGGITRMLALYQDIGKAGKIGSVRSTRSYFLDLAESHDAILIHAGASVYAYDALEVRPIIHVDGIYNSSIFYRDENRMSFGYEHSLFTDGKLVAENISKSVKQLQHKNGYICNMRFGKPSSEKGLPAKSVTVEFSGYKTGRFDYKDDGLYYITQYGEPYRDGNTGKQMAVKNLLVLYAEHSPVSKDDPKHLDIDLVGSGAGIYACSGKYVDIIWTRDRCDSQFVYKLKDGSDLTFSPGTSYINILSTKKKALIS